MWRYLTDVKEPEAKKKKVGLKDDDKTGKSYESGRTRSWNEKWRVDDNGKRREWLFYDTDNNKMFCNMSRNLIRCLHLIFGGNGPRARTDGQGVLTSNIQSPNALQ